MTARAVFYTPTVTTTPRKLDSEIGGLIRQFHWAIEDTLYPVGDDEFIHHRPISKSKLDSHTELLIVDEADRLKTAGLEQLRDYHDRLGIGLILIGMPGLERRLARYPQLYSRIGFAHEYRPLSTDELAFVLTHHWRVLGLTFSADDFTDTEALATVGRVTNGNFRLVERLFAQIARILEINNLRSITREVVETAREALVIGTT